MKRNYYKNKDELELGVNEMVARGSIAPIQKMLVALYTQLDEAEDEQTRRARRAAADRVHYRCLVQWVRAKLVARCDGSIMSGEFDRFVGER